ncbi:MAG TPA: DUF998 domain-containing protein [Acidimicrobiia bacterium]|nr:DUF998 domain-containing protein [Acidimicrobiia bacterium]
MRGRVSTPVFGRIGAIGNLSLVGVAVAMHLLQPEKNPLDTLASQYANGRLGWLMVLGFLAAGIGTLAVAEGLRRTLAPDRWKTASVALMVAAGVGLVGTGAFVEDVPLADGTVSYTFSGQAHGFFSVVMFVSLIAVAFVLSGVFGRDPRWADFALTTRLFAWTILALYVISTGTWLLFPPGTGGVAGLTQRLFGASFLVWLFRVARRLERPASP